MSHVPPNLHPYLYLSRTHAPIGTLLLLHPCLWSCTLASSATPPLALYGLFTVGSFVMRGAGCTINDMWDRDIDSKVARTKTRPLAAGDLTMRQAAAFLGVQLTAGLGVLLSLPNVEPCFYLGCMSLPLVLLYPTAKRWTGYPQAMLGLTFNWGAFVGWTAVTGEIDIVSCAPMYAAGVSWTMLYDTLYAHQDKKDDEKVGVMSTARTWGDNKTHMYLAAGGFGAGMSAQGVMCDVGVLYWPFLAAAQSHLLWQVKTADLNNIENLAYRFWSNQVVGGLVTAGCLAGKFL